MQRHLARASECRIRYSAATGSSCGIGSVGQSDQSRSRS